MPRHETHCIGGNDTRQVRWTKLNVMQRTKLPNNDKVRVKLEKHQ